ncbi:divergent polysaccharide deacetylase family protein [Defluviimonas sp. WL0050]|uniref:Divergent polysaccharide deacetylase family protein n=1 Tax=Albidovulum litorale TaxID=2984134 RepID=A0ABT2ZPV6_9RHOB|nr:divergent polysaccharide deacetylase family protein [Defluviimonas sp. WL0050]MCV2873180.1 divergent polysaccharide deacetylase family protein [Defluviimonas sp. WL0050]
MGRGLVNGVLVGFLISGSALAIASLMAPPVGTMREAAGAADVDTGAGSVDGAAVQAEPVVAVEPEATEAATAEPVAEPEPAVTAEPQPEVEPVEETVVAEPETAPEVQDIAITADPTAEPTAADVVADMTEPAPEAPETPVLKAAEAAAETALPETTPAVVPEMADESAAVTAAQEPPAVADVPVVAEAAPETAPDAPQAPALENDAPENAEEEIVVAAAPEPPASEPESKPEPDVAPVNEVQDNAVVEAAPEAATEPAAAAADEPVILTVESQPLTNAAAPQPGFSQAVPGVKINRLPSIGDTTETLSDEPSSDIVTLPSTEDLPAVARYAAPFDNPESLPIIGVVLIDRGEQNGGLDAAALAGIGLPVTVAIDPTRPDAGERAAAYRAAGLEIAILAADLPSGAKASDMEVSYHAFVRALPETVTLIGQPDAAFQSDRRLAQHLVALLSAEGRGLVTYDRGLNPAQQAAFRDGLPHASVYRELDASGENEAAIARYLDRVAFEAARQGEILVAGTTAPTTVQALKDWAAAGAKGTVIAPASAVMLARQ